LTTQPHKEERFIIAFWPFLLIAAAGTLGGWLARSAARRTAMPSGRVALGFTNALRSTRLQSASIGLIVSAISLESLFHSSRRELDLTTSFASRSDYSRGLMQAQSWVGTRKDLLGLLIEQSGGGYVWLGHSAPMVTASGDFARGLIVNPVINYAVVLSGSGNETLVRNANFVKSRTFGNYKVYRKKYRFTADSDYLAVMP
jgi:hypothetical protein